jgi:Transposase
VEGAHGVGRALAQRLVTNGEHVVDVPAKLAARVRVLSTGHGRKSDPDDAVSIAVAAQSAPGLRQVAVEDRAVLLHLLTNRREDLAGKGLARGPRLGATGRRRKPAVARPAVVSALGDRGIGPALGGAQPALTSSQIRMKWHKPAATVKPCQTSW